MSYWSFNHTLSRDDMIHYGRKGMRWYQHIYGDPDPRARYGSDYKDAEIVIKSLSSKDYKEFGTPPTGKKPYYYKVIKKDGTPKAFGLAMETIKRGQRIVDLSLAVSPDSRRKGLAIELGSEMIQKILSDPKIDKINWAAKKDNTSSINLAKKLGFKEDSQTDNYYILSMTPKRHT